MESGDFSLKYKQMGLSSPLRHSLYVSSQSGKTDCRPLASSTHTPQPAHITVASVECGQWTRRGEYVFREIEEQNMVIRGELW